MNCFIKHNIIIIILVSFLFPFFIFAQEKELCSIKGYTILTVNGIFTDEQRARENKDDLKKNLFPSYKGEPVVIDYIFNPSHAGGIGDTVDVAVQKITENMVVSDYDLVEIVKDASEKVKTQKVLLVAHSQGNFYANSFYNEVTGFNKIPPQSFGIYGVASPASYISGLGAKYITSSTDSVINKIRLGGVLNVLPANVDIDLLKDIGSNGHNFSDVYLKYQSGRIVKEIEKSLDWLMPNGTQDFDKPCIPTPKVTILHKVTGNALVFLDNSVDTIKTGVDYTALALSNGVNYVISGIASLFKTNNLAMNNSAAAVVAVNEEPKITSNTKEETPVVIVKKESKQNIIKEPEQILEIVPEIVPITENNLVANVSPDNNFSPLYIPISSGDSGVRGSGQRFIPTPPDTTAPVITILGNNPETIEFGSVYSDAGATAADDKDGDVSANIVTVNFVNTGVAGTYTVTYDVSDANANTATEAIRTVIVSEPAVTYLENSQISLPGAISGGRFYYCSDVSYIQTFGSIFYVLSGGVNLDTIGVRGVAGSGTVTSGSLKVYPFNSTSVFSFDTGVTLPLGALIATSDTFNPSTWSSVPDSGTNPSDFPYVYMTFPHVFLPEGTYFMTFGDCATPSSDYFGVKGSGSGFTQGFQGLFNFVYYGTLAWNHLGGFSFDYIINSAVH